jgi:Icc-related predicted phosphoesterase
MKITCTGCLHGHYPKTDGGDLLIVTGDLTARDSKQEYVHFVDWYLKQEYKKKVFIPGNHDTKIQNGEYYFNHDWLGYLFDSGTEFEGLKIWGSPWSLWFDDIHLSCTAFTETEKHLEKKYALIPDDIDILITHQPPHGIFDRVFDYNTGKAKWTGSLSLREHVIARIKPKLHVFSHIHEHGGKVLDTNVTKFVNCSHMNERYKPVNRPINIELWESNK